MPDEHLSLHEIKVTSKTGEQRRRQQRQAEKAARGAGRGAHVSSAIEEVEVSEAELQGVPVLWVQVSTQAWVRSCRVAMDCRRYSATLKSTGHCAH